MAKRFLSLLILFLVLLGVFYIYPRKEQIFQTKKEDSLAHESSPATTKSPSPLQKRRIIGVKPQDAQQFSDEDLETDNIPSENWEEVLTQTLEAQGGSSIHEIDIKKTESAILKRDNKKIAVESVVITLTREDGAQSSFRALIDSETGKILETWDRPVFDPVHPNGNFKVKLNPVYHGN